VRVRILIPRRKPRRLVSRQSNKRAGQVALVVALTAVFGSLYALLGDSGLMAVMRMRARATQMQYDIAAKEHANGEILDIIKPLRDEDPDAIEKIAREKLFMALPGDTIYVLPPETKSTAPVERNDAGSPTAPPLPSRR